MEKRSPVRLAEVAREAGVSPTTASLILNGRADQYRIAARTCARVRRIAAKRHFTPNIHARAMAGRRSLLVGVIVGDISGSFWPEILAGIEEALEKERYHMLLGTSHYRSVREEDLFSFMLQKNVDGFIYSPQWDSPEPPAARVRAVSRTRPVVSLTSPLPGLPGAYNDNAEGGRLVARHLHGLGHRRIAYVGPLTASDDRGQPFLDELAAHGVRGEVLASVDALLENAARFSAAFFHNDCQVAELYSKAGARSVSIPRDLSVVGYDNLDLVRHLAPRPTTVHQFKRELGVAAAETLLGLLAGSDPTPELQRRFVPYLVDGESVRRVRSRKD